MRWLPARTPRHGLLATTPRERIRSCGRYALRVRFASISAFKSKAKRRCAHFKGNRKNVMAFEELPGIGTFGSGSRSAPPRAGSPAWLSTSPRAPSGRNQPASPSGIGRSPWRRSLCRDRPAHDSRHRVCGSSGPRRSKPRTPSEPSRSSRRSPTTANFGLGLQMAAGTSSFSRRRYRLWCFRP